MAVAPVASVNGPLGVMINQFGISLVRVASCAAPHPLHRLSTFFFFTGVHVTGHNPYQRRVFENTHGCNQARSDFRLVLSTIARKIDLASPSFDTAEHFLLLTGVLASAAKKWMTKRAHFAARSSLRLQKSKSDPYALQQQNDLGMHA